MWAWERETVRQRVLLSGFQFLISWNLHLEQIKQFDKAYGVLIVDWLLLYQLVEQVLLFS